MLLNFSFSNFKSFRDPQQFTMERPTSERHRGAEPVSTVAGVFGANAAGKSSFLDAVRFARQFVVSDLRVGEFLEQNRMPFLLDPDSAGEPSEFLFEFVGADGKVYEYQFSVDQQAVLYEALKAKELKPRARFKTLYAREREGVVGAAGGTVGADGADGAVATDGADGVDGAAAADAAGGDGADAAEAYRYGASFKGPKKQLEEMTTPGRLFLSTLHRFSVASAKAPFAFFEKELMVVSAAAYGEELSFLTDKLKARPDYVKALSGLLRASDLGIQGIEVREVPNPLLSSPLVQRCGQERFAALLANMMQVVQPELSEEEALRQVATAGPGAESTPTLVFSHAGKAGAAAFDAGLESDGTIAGLAFFSLALRVIACGATLFVDEIDSSLHPLYVRQLVELFKNTETNPTGAQLVFTTHDASLIFNGGAWESVLAEDQVWLVEKDLGGSSDLYALTEVRGVRHDEDFGRNYLNGVYGAAPSANLTGAFVRALGILGVLPLDAA